VIGSGGASQSGESQYLLQANTVDSTLVDGFPRPGVPVRWSLFGSSKVQANIRSPFLLSQS
jgi:hypothetical protein